jgi:hypothetical protein
MKGKRTPLINLSVIIILAIGISVLGYAVYLCLFEFISAEHGMKRPPEPESLEFKTECVRRCPDDCRCEGDPRSETYEEPLWEY